jgi:hypothetical protein
MPDKTFPNPINADPSKFSLREEALNFNLVEYDKYNRPVYIDQETGERFYKIKFKQNFNKLESKNENIITEAEADSFILRNIFQDYDHSHSSSYGLKLQNNLIIDEETGKLSFFDFDTASFDYESEYSQNPIDLKNQFEIMFQANFANFNSNPNRHNIIIILKKKINMLMGLFPDNEFQRFKKIVQKSEVKLTEEQQRILFNNLKLRLEVLSKVLLESEPSN